MASTSDSTLVIVGLVLIIAFGIITYIYWFTPLGQNPRFVPYLSAIGVLALIVSLVSFFIVNAQQQQQRIEDEHSIQTELSQTYMLENEHIFATTPELRNFYRRLSTPNPILDDIPDIPITPEVQIQEVHMAMRLYRIIEDVNTEVMDFPNSWNNPAFTGWEATFQRWLLDPLMIELWPYIKYQFNASTQEFVERHQLSRV